MKEFLQYGCWVTLGLTALLWGLHQLTTIFGWSSSPYWMVAAAGMLMINIVFSGALFFTQGGLTAIRKLFKQ